MPCLILTGHPCAGKTTLAHLIEERALALHHASIDRVVILNEASACPDQSKSACYATSQAEKATRAALKSAFDRTVSGNNTDRTLVILDSLNYIKGYRYELYCISKAAKERHAVVWVLNDVSIAQKWNKQRQQQAKEDSYDDKLMEELIQRYEPPDARNRWEVPLYRIDTRPDAGADDSVSTGLAQDLLERSVYNMHNLSHVIQEQELQKPQSTASNKDKKTCKKGATSATFKRAGFKRATKPVQQPGNGEDTPPVSTETTLAEESAAPEQPNTGNTETAATASTVVKQLSLEERVDEMLNSFLLNVEPLQQGTSTIRHEASDANVLHNVDSLTQQVCRAISTAQNKSTVASGGKLAIELHDGQSLTLDAPRQFSLTELRRLRRQYLQWIATYPPEDTTERGVAQSFLAYIETQR